MTGKHPPACLRRIQIAERNEAERGQAGVGRVVTRREVEWSGLNRTESGYFPGGSLRFCGVGPARLRA